VDEQEKSYRRRGGPLEMRGGKAPKEAWARGRVSTISESSYCGKNHSPKVNLKSSPMGEIGKKSEKGVAGKRVDQSALCQGSEGRGKKKKKVTTPTHNNS